MLKREIYMNEPLKKEVESLLKQGLNESQIKQSMTEKGYALSEINEAIGDHIDTKYTKKRNFKPLIIISSILAIILIIGLTYIFWPKKVIIENIVDYSEYSPDWIKTIENITINNETNEISVIEATKGKGNFIVDQERYIENDGTIISLFYGGSYSGNIFNNIYYDKNSNVKMRIWNSMNPNDGIIESFGLFKKENEEFVLYLFVDEDWKKMSNENLGIIWGNDIRNKENLNFKKFDFSKSKDGIYIEKITNDVSWFTNQNPVVGRLFLGEISLEDVKQSYYNRTFMALT
jgi:hypothetical protein